MNLKPRKTRTEDWEERKPSAYLWWLAGISLICIVTVISITAWNKNEIKAASFCSLCTHSWDECMAENVTKERFDKECNYTRYHVDEVVVNQEQIDLMNQYLSSCVHSVNITLGFDEIILLSLETEEIFDEAKYMLPSDERAFIHQQTRSFAVYDYGKNEYGPYVSDHMEIKGNTKADCIVQSDYMICDQINATRMRCAQETTHKCNESRMRIDFFGGGVESDIPKVSHRIQTCDSFYDTLLHKFNLTLPKDTFEFYRAVRDRDFVIRKNVTTDRCEEVQQ